MARTKPSPHLYALVLLVVLPHTVAADRDSPGELAFTVFTDLAPLLALFGEQFARQFMSESLTWLDHIIFAMAPLGILTAIVGAIRVSGPAWARAFIGRARESRAAAEIELMSSTSCEVCEVYNGKGVVRAMGTPKITQFILFPAEYRTDQGTCGIHTLETAYVREQPFLERGKYGVKTDWDAFKKEYVHDVGTGIALGAGLAMGFGTNIRVDLDDNNVAGKTKAQNNKGSALVGLEERTPGARRRGFWLRSKPKPEDVENPRALKVFVHRENQPQDEKDEKNTRRARQPTFPPELEGSAPNLQLNLPSTIPSHKSTIKDLWIAAVVAIIVQVSVLVVSAVTTFHTFRAVGRPQTNYGFWLFIAGTLCLDSGMILCSFVIEQSTQESSWRVASSKNYREPGMETNAVGTSASDQSNILTESEKPRNTTPLQLFWLQQKHTVNDQDFEPFLILGGHKSKILTSSRRLDYDSWKSTGTIRRIPVPKWSVMIAEKRYEFLAVSASLLGLLGFIMQFEGLRGLNWPTAVSQLLAILAVALIRAIVRRRLGEGPSAIRAHAGHELDWLTLRLVYEDNALKAPPDSEGPAPLKPYPRWKVLTRPDLSDLSDTEQQNSSKYSASQSTDSSEEESDQATPRPPPRPPPRLLVKRGEMVPGVQGDVSLRYQRDISRPEKGDSPWLFPQTSQMAVNVRRRLGQLARCPGPASREAIALAQAMSLILTELCPVQEDHDKIFTWTLDTKIGHTVQAPYTSHGSVPSQIPSKPARLDSTESGWSDISATRISVNTPQVSRLKTKDATQPPNDPVTLRAHGNSKDGWTMHPASLDAILSLWMSSLGKPGSKEGLDDTHGQSKPRDDATEDVETGSWLSKMASATVKYRRVLGEDPAPYAPPKATGVATRSDGIDEKASSIRTDILTRDLSWWTSDPRIVALHGEANDTLGTGKIALEIGFNGLEPAPKSDADRAEQGTQPPKRLTAIQEPEAAHTQRLQPKDVPIVSNGPLVTVISHHLFSAFMWAVSDYIQEDKLDKATVEDPELFDNSEFHSTWYLPTLRNKRLMKVARAIAGFGLGSVDDVLLGIIPPLSHRGILPNEAMMAVLLTKTKEHERYHDWDQTQEAYRHLMELPLHPKRLDRITYEVVVEIIEFLFLTTDTVTDLDVMVGPQKDIESEQGKSLREAVKAIMESLKAHDLLFKKAEELRWFYHKQRRKEKYERLYRSLKSIQRVRALNSPTNEDGQPKEPVQENNHASERSRSENKDIRKLDSSTQVVSEPDNELRKLTKFTSRHAKASRWRKDLKPSKQAAEPDEVGKQDIFGWYPLHYATVNRDDEVFEIILEGCSAKAQHELKDRSGRTPLHYAAMYEPGRIKRLIGNEQKGKSAANTRGRDGTLPIHCAARSAKMESVEQLSKYSNPAALDAFNRSPLHLGVMISNKEVVEHFCKDDNVAIIQTGAELLGRTALHLALVANSHRNNRDQKMREIIVALMTREKDLRAVTIVDEVCSSPITWALESNDEDFLGKILTRLSKVERRQSEDGQSNVSTECFKSILYDAVRLRSEFALRLAFRHIKDQKLEPAWIRDAFQTAQKLRRDDMLLLMLGIVDSLIPESSLVRDYTPPEVTTEFKTTTRSTDKHQPVISRSPPTNEDARPRVEVEIPSHTEPDDTAVNGRSIPFSSDFLNDLRKEFGNEIVTKLRQWIRSGNFSEIEKKLTYRDDSIATSIDWNQKDAGKRSGIAYLAKLRPKPDSNDALTGSDIRIRVLEALWKLWSQDERAKALNEPQGRYDKTPLIYAVRRDLRPLASFFLDKGAKVRDLDSRDMSAFTYALQKNDEAWKKMWKTMVESDPQVVNEPNRSYYRTTPLIEAVRYDHDKTLDFLSTCPELDPNIQDKEGDTALVWCYWQNEPMLKDLVDKFPKLDPHRRNLEGLSPLMVAYKDAFSDKLTPAIRDMFSARGKRMKEYEGTLMLSHAICRKKTELVKFLLGVGADPCSTDDTGRSQIELAAYHGDIELFKVLCEGRKILGHQLKRVYHACTQRADTTGDRILGELIEMKVAIELTDLDANGWTVRDCAACAGTLQSLMKWPQLQASLGRATDEKAGSQHIPPSSWAVRGDNPFIEADGCLLRVTSPFPGYLRRLNEEKARLMVRADHCIPHQSRYYWKLEIVNLPDDGFISMGVCCHSSDHYGHVGWSRSLAVGYHNDDGGIFLNYSARSLHKGPIWDVGDVVGCLVKVKNTVRTVQFFHKGSKIEPAIQLPKEIRGQLYPCVGLDVRPGTKGTSVKATFGAEVPNMDVDQPTITEDVGTNADRSQRGLDTALREGEEQAASSGSFKGNEEPHRDVVQDLTDVAAQVTNLSGLEAAEPGSNTSEKDLVTGASGTSNDQPAEQGSQYPTEGIVQLATDAKQNDTVPQDVPSQVDGATQRDKNSRSEVSDDQVAEGGAQEARDSQSGAAVEQKEASEGEGIVEGALEPQVDGATEGAQVEAPDQEQDAVAGAEERPR